MIKDIHNEKQYIRQLLKQLEYSKMVACVSDTYNIWNFLEILGEMKEEILEATNKGGTIVVRPDSGDPVKVTLEVIEILGEKFGYTINSKGYKVLPNYIRIIQGDGIDLTTIENILDNYELNGWSADNIAFGMGGALLQKVNRDTLKFAMKGCEVTINGKYIPIYKDPITDPGKSSKKGMQYVLKDKNGNFYSKSREDYTNTEYRTSYLVQMYNPIRLVFGVGDTFEDVRERAKV